MSNFCIWLIFEFKQYKNANIANFMYYGKTRMNDLVEDHSAQEGFKIAPFNLLPRWQIYKRR